MEAITLENGTLYGTPIFIARSPSATLQPVFGASYHGPTQTWRFPAFAPVRERVLADLRKVAKNIVVPPDDSLPLEVPDDFSFLTQPYQHQRDGLALAYRYLRVGLFFAPGLGKCKIMADLLRLTGDSALILCPRIMLYTWVD